MSIFAQKWFSEWMPEPPVFGRATNILSSLIQHRPEDAWERILALISFSEDNEYLDLVGAGPLEDLLCEHGPIFIDRVESQALENASMVQCLSYVWGYSRMEPSVYARVREISGPMQSFPPTKSSGGT
jgi:hypothetical protein